ncbi:MauE/DoxX family redox-associated membrane protein [Fulvivirgaceae bacterium BMA12]|uniref:MauE/DoxX family redox-associated membrane protein n=1 Tax=Agaribacillus aureus TaxID=3051825 RepID=A0ABT8L3K2_9BACT|nr:MauE/DoxX family redox-associated membrane protein [Fulvivirgaceae bacterium BMA12]
MKKKITLEIICFLFIFLFTYAAVMKLMDVEKFIVQIGQSPLLTKFAELVAWVIPAAELLIAGMLAFPRFRSIGLYMAFSLMVMFTAYIVAILQFSEKIPCACGGVLDSMGWTQHLIFNIGFVVLALIGIILHTPLQRNNQVVRD